MLPSHTQILHCHREGAMPKWQHTHSQSQMVLHTHTFFSFTSKCVIIYTPNTHSHAYKYGCNIQSVIWSHHTHTHTLSHRVVGSVVYGADVLEVWVRCITRRVITAFHSSWSLWFTSHPAPLLYIDLRGDRRVSASVSLPVCCSAWLIFFSTGAPVFFSVRLFLSLHCLHFLFFSFFFYRKSKNASGLKSKWKTGKFNHGYQFV